MKKLKNIWKTSKYIIACFFIILILPLSSHSNELPIEIKGNNFTDIDVIISLLNNIPDTAQQEYSDEIIKILNNSKLFSDVSVQYINNKYIITVQEFPNINKLYFKNNERLKDEELEYIASEINFTNLNIISLNKFINEVKKLYESFGYNNIKIDYTEELDVNSNTVNLYFDIFEGKITKIKNIFISGNDNITSQDLKEIIKSKTKSITNIFANNNYKPVIIERDKFLIINYYKNNGFLDIKVKTKIEYLENNKVNIYFIISEGAIYSLSSINILDDNKILNSNTKNLIEIKIKNYLDVENIYSLEKIKILKNDISSIIFDNNIEFFEIDIFDKKDENKIDILFQINPIIPKYTRQINIIGNYRTYDYVIRRELEIVEGDAVYETQVDSIRQKLLSLNLFENVNIKQEIIDNNNIDLIIEVEEKQTGTFNAGVSVGTLDGFAIVTGLRERNFYGTGRSLDVLLNTSEDKNQFKLETTDRLSYDNDVNISYNLNYKQQDFSNASSYKLDTFSSGVGIGYKINDNLGHSINLEYLIKDYKITNSSSVSNSILNSSGSNVSFLLKNDFRYSTLNPGFISKRGIYFNFNNAIETPSSSNNGFLRNIFTIKQYYSNENSIYSIQTKLGNIFSLNNNDILTDDKFSLGGRWLRGFDNYGAGPRNSRASYVGGNNIVVTKLDYSYEITNKSDFPIYLNFFNDYGLVWENKTTPTKNDNNLRSSAGFGIKYYSPIGPIGFSWGFPLMDEEYDIKRMFLFSIGNID